MLATVIKLIVLKYTFPDLNGSGKIKDKTIIKIIIKINFETRKNFFQFK